MRQVDLYLGGELGLWSLEQARTEDVANVFTFDEKIAESAQARRLRVWTQNANALEFAASQVALSVHYPRVLKSHLIARYQKIYNLHPGFLPWGRGYYPVFWAMWENTPAGASLHEISEGVDEGAIVAQEQVEFSEFDTGGSVHNRVHEAEKRLFMEYWSKIVSGHKIVAFPQVGQGSHHFKRDFLELKERAPWREMDAEELMKLIRCLTFPGYTGLEITLAGERFAVRLERLDCAKNTPSPESQS